MKFSVSVYGVPFALVAAYVRNFSMLGERPHLLSQYSVVLPLETIEENDKQWVFQEVIIEEGGKFVGEVIGLYDKMLT